MTTGIIMGNIRAMGVATINITPASVGAATTVEQTFTLPSAQVGDFVDVSHPSLVAGVSLTNARVSAPNTIAITFTNATAGALTPASGNYLVNWFRTEAVQSGIVV